MKKFFSKLALVFLSASLVSLGLMFVDAHAACLPGYSGGTGLCTATTSNIGQVPTVNSISNGTPVYTFQTGSGSGSFTTTTINGTQALVFHLVGDGTTISSTVSGATTTFTALSTSTFNATGTPFYAPFWNASGTALTPTSSIFQSGTNVGIGTTSPGTALVLGSGQITVPNGSASAPSYSFSTDPNLGFYSNGNGAIRFVSAGSDESQWGDGYINWKSTSFRWGTSITSADVYLYRPSAGQLNIDSNGSGGAATLTVSGKVGIGTTAPAASLHVVSSASTTAIFAQSGTATTTIIQGTASSTACQVMYANGTASSFQVVAGVSYYYNTSTCN